MKLEGGCQRKYIDWKKTKLFGFRWNWDEEKKLRGMSADFLPSPTCPPHLFMTDNDASSVLGGGGHDFVDTIIAVTTRKGWEIIDLMNNLYKEINSRISWQNLLSFFLKG